MNVSGNVVSQTGMGHDEVAKNTSCVLFLERLGTTEKLPLLDHHIQTFPKRQQLHKILKVSNFDA